MPHSTPSDKSVSQEDEDDLLPDAPAANAADTTIAESNDLPGDVAMDVEEGKKDVDMVDVKLQDLFNDMDEEDDEFSSSRVDSKIKTESSPPAAPM